MSTEFVDETTIFNKFSEGIRQGNQEILIASPWISKWGLGNLYDDLKKNARISKILIRLKEKSDADINDLDTLDLLKLNGAKIRLCPELHAKMLIVDNKIAIIGSSNITASGLGITNAPNIECGIITDESQIVGNAKRKFEDTWRKAIDYEHGDLRIENNMIVFSSKGNQKMTGNQLADLGGGVFFKSLTQSKIREMKPIVNIKIPEPFGIRSRLKEKAQEFVSPLSNEEFQKLQKSYWQTVSQEFLSELIQKNKEFVRDTFTPKNYALLLTESPQITSIWKGLRFGSKNASIIDKYKDQTIKFVDENKDTIEKLKTKGIGKNLFAFVEGLDIPKEEKAYFLIGAGLFLMAAPAVGLVIPLPPMGQRIVFAAIWGQCVALGAVLILLGTYQGGFIKPDIKGTASNFK